MGTRKDCEKAFTAALYAGREIVVDRCNFDEAQRRTWLQYALGYGAECIGVQIMIPIELCIERALARKDHPTLGTKDSIHSVIPRSALAQPFRRTSHGHHLTVSPSGQSSAACSRRGASLKCVRGIADQAAHLVLALCSCSQRVALM